MKNRNIHVLLFVGLFFILALSAFYFKQFVSPEDITRVRLNAKAHNLQIADNGNRDKPESQTNHVVISGPITALPWENDEKFKNAIEKNGNLILLAAYQTVLKDPLPGEEYNVHLGANLLAGKVIKPGGIFSQNHTVGPYVESRGFKKGPTYVGTTLITTIGGGVCKIASTLYNVTILSNLEIVERHHHGMPVPYVPSGQDATVAYGAKDFKFRNNTDDDIMIWAQGIGNVLYMAFYGKSKPPAVQWHHEILERQVAPKLYKSNPSLPAGTEKMVIEGMDGLTVRSWITIKNEDGTETTKQLGISYYKPFPYVMERGE